VFLVLSVALSGVAHIPVFKLIRFTCSGRSVPDFLLTALGIEVFVSLCQRPVWRLWNLYSG
ncbi:unnamed protein product, partial [Brassica rapa subsp. trilocularis]